jgi:teichuronic acid biosynthesis glycosyltransferase TuaH
VAELTSWLLRLQLRRATRALGGSVRAVIAASPLLNPLGARDEGLKVFWAQDDFVGGAQAFGLSTGRIARGVGRLAAAADVIVAANPIVAGAWRSRGYQPATIAFGCDSELFARSDEAPLPTDVRLSPPIAGFVGHLSDRIDIRLLEALADRGRSLLLVGPSHDRVPLAGLQRLLSRPTVQWVGPKRFDELPSYQRVIDVGLVPYTASRFNRGSFPLKTLEYLAAGKPVVATDLPATRWLDTELVTIASAPADFADAVDRALDQPRSAVLIDQRRAFAARHDWTVRAREFARLLELPSALAPMPSRSAAWT